MSLSDPSRIGHLLLGSALAPLAQGLWESLDLKEGVSPSAAVAWKVEELLEEDRRVLPLVCEAYERGIGSLHLFLREGVSSPTLVVERLRPFFERRGYEARDFCHLASQQLLWLHTQKVVTLELLSVRELAQILGEFAVQDLSLWKRRHRECLEPLLELLKSGREGPHYLAELLEWQNLLASFIGLHFGRLLSVASPLFPLWFYCAPTARKERLAYGQKKLVWKASLERRGGEGVRKKTFDFLKDCEVDYGKTSREVREDLEERLKWGAVLWQTLVEHLEKALKEQDWQKRREAARLLGELKAEETLGELLSLFEDHVWEVREEAARAVARLGQELSEVKDWLLALFQEGDWREKDWRKIQSSAWALGELKAEEALPLWQPILCDDYSHVCREAVRDGMVSIGEPSVPYLLEGLRSQWEAVSRTAEEGLVAIGKPALKYLLPLLKTLREGERVRIRAMRTLAHIGAGDENVLCHLVSMLGDRSREVVLRTAEVLGEVKPPISLLLPFLLEALRSPNAHLRYGAVLVLGRLRVKQALAHLIRALEDTDQKVREGAVEALGMLGPEAKEAAVPLLQSCAKSYLPLIRSVGEALRKIQPCHEKLEPLLRKMVNSQNWREKTGALYALGALKIPFGASILVELLLQESLATSLEEVVVESLSWMGEEAVPFLVERLAEGNRRSQDRLERTLHRMGALAVKGLCGALASKDAKVRLAALRALDRIGGEARREVPSDLLERLLQCVRSDSELERMCAVSVLGKFRFSAAVPHLVDCLWLEKSEGVLQCICLALSELSHFALRPFVEKLLECEGQMPREALCAMSSHSCWREEVFSYLEKLFQNSKSGEVRQKILKALQLDLFLPFQVVSLCGQALKDGDGKVRQAAREALQVVAERIRKGLEADLFWNPSEYESLYREIQEMVRSNGPLSP